MIIAISFAIFISKLIGGLCTLYFKDKLHLVLGFSAGAVVGVVFFDLFPEAIELGQKFYPPETITIFMALGFLLYLIFDRAVILHSQHTEHSDLGNMEVSGRGLLGASSLSLHSFFDGLAIGLAFQVSSGIGLIVATAVLVHTFSDGINTVNLILKNQGDVKMAILWLVFGSLAPVFGVISTLFFTLPEQSLSIILALFSGFFLYIGASELVPESHHAHPKLLTTLMTVLGAGVLFIVIRLIQ